MSFFVIVVLVVVGIPFLPPVDHQIVLKSSMKFRVLHCRNHLRSGVKSLSFRSRNNNKWMLRDVHFIVNVVRIDSILTFEVDDKIVKNHTRLDHCLHCMTFPQKTIGCQDMVSCLQRSKCLFNVLPCCLLC